MMASKHSNALNVTNHSILRTHSNVIYALTLVRNPSSVPNAAKISPGKAGSFAILPHTQMNAHSNAHNATALFDFCINCKHTRAFTPAKSCTNASNVVKRLLKAVLSLSTWDHTQMSAHSNAHNATAHFNFHISWKNTLAFTPAKSRSNASNVVKSLLKAVISLSTWEHTQMNAHTNAHNATALFEFRLSWKHTRAFTRVTVHIIVPTATRCFLIQAHSKNILAFTLGKNRTNATNVVKRSENPLLSKNTWIHTRDEHFFVNFSTFLLQWNCVIWEGGEGRSRGKQALCQMKSSRAVKFHQTWRPSRNLCKRAFFFLVQPKKLDETDEFIPHAQYADFLVKLWGEKLKTRNDHLCIFFDAIFWSHTSRLKAKLILTFGVCQKKIPAIFAVSMDCCRSRRCVGQSTHAASSCASEILELKYSTTIWRIVPSTVLRCMLATFITVRILVMCSMPSTAWPSKMALWWRFSCTEKFWMEWGKTPIGKCFEVVDGSFNIVAHLDLNLGYRRPISHVGRAFFLL